MANAKRDQNHIPVLLALSDADGSTVVPIQADATDHTLMAQNGTGGSDLSGDVATRDANRVPVFMAVSSADGLTPVPIYADEAAGAILIDST